MCLSICQSVSCYNQEKSDHWFVDNLFLCDISSSSFVLSQLSIASRSPFIFEMTSSCVSAIANDYFTIARLSLPLSLSLSPLTHHKLSHFRLFILLSQLDIYIKHLLIISSKKSHCRLSFCLYCISEISVNLDLLEPSSVARLIDNYF